MIFANHELYDRPHAFPIHHGSTHNLQSNRGCFPILFRLSKTPRLPAALSQWTVCGTEQRGRHSDRPPLHEVCECPLRLPVRRTIHLVLFCYFGKSASHQPYYLFLAVPFHPNFGCRNLERRQSTRPLTRAGNAGALLLPGNSPNRSNHWIPRTEV